MRHRGQALLWFLLFLLIIGISFLGYLIYLNLPGVPIALKGINLHPVSSQTGNLSNSVQFYPRMRFKDRIITYDFGSECSAEKTSQVNGAFNLLEADTFLRFALDSNNPEIEIACSDIAPPPSNKGHFVAGEGGPYEIINASLYTIILSSKIALYRDETCSSPHIALHELLHALGFDHNNNPLSILYPTLDCKQTLDKYIIDELNNLYAQDSLPDLTIVSLEGTKSGRYLSFSISVMNQGLAESQSVNLSLLAEDGSVVKDFDLGNIELGATKILTVSNLVVPRTSKSFKFVVDRAGLVKELDRSNNDAELTLES